MRKITQQPFQITKTVLDKLNEYIKNSRIRSREILAEQSSPQGETGVEKESDVAPFRVRFNVLASQIEFLNGSVDILTATSYVEIEKYVSSSEKFLGEFFQLNAEMAQKCPTSFERVFEKDIRNYVFDIRDDIKMAKILRKELQNYRETSAKRGMLEKDQVQYVMKADNLIAELHIRFRSLGKKYSVKLSDLSDYQILDIQKDKSADLEFNSIFG